MIDTTTAPQGNNSATSSATTAPTAQTEQPIFAAAGRLKAALEAKGIDSSTIAFLLGNFVSKVSNTVMKEVIEALENDITSPDVGGLTDDAARQVKIEQLFKDKTGKTIHQRREEVAEEMVAEFEKAGKVA
jgi:hypothetical protein